jgi:hypothetical protein
MRAVIAAAAASLLMAGCASSPAERPDFAARNRPRADVEAAAQAAGRRGELDKVCDWL